METCIVLISVDYSNARKVCNIIENQKFDNRQELNKTIKEQLVDCDGDGDGGVSIFRLTDFMEEVNDQYLDVLTEHFISCKNWLNNLEISFYILIFVLSN
jgi:hypothetical protein